MAVAPTNAQSGSNTALKAFDIVSQNLKNLGALSLDEFFSADHLHTDISYDSPLSSAFTSLNNPSSSFIVGASEANLKATAVDQGAITRLHQTCQRVYGCSLKFEFLEGRGTASKQCILSITRPNGATRCYKTEPVFSRKIEAKAHAATIAINMGAIEFMITGDVKIGKKSAHDSTEDMPAEVQQIHDACQRWRGGQAKPRWYSLRDPKYGTEYGCALKVQLSLHSFRVYSTDTTFDTFAAAKLECAKAALSEGVLDFIENDSAAYSVHNGSFSATSTPRVYSLQAFYESLPRPFPENFGDKTVAEINAPGYLNGAVQAARGSKFTVSFIPFSIPGGFHGCLLRLERPGECKSYLVEPHFAKRAEAKSGVCFQAFSEGICAYIRTVSDVTEMKISDAMRKLASNRIIPSLNNEFSKKRPGQPIEYEYHQDKDAFGCCMTLSLRESHHTRTYSVPAEYRNKNDAKLALICVAASQGAIEFLRFSGRPVPRNYIPFMANDAAKALDDLKSDKKRKDPDMHDDDAGAAKKARTDFGSENGTAAIQSSQGSRAPENRPFDNNRKRKRPQREDDDEGSQHSVPHKRHFSQDLDHLRTSDPGGSSSPGPDSRLRYGEERHSQPWPAPRPVAEPSLRERLDHPGTAMPLPFYDPSAGARLGPYMISERGVDDLGPRRHSPPRLSSKPPSPRPSWENPRIITTERATRFSSDLERQRTGQFNNPPTIRRARVMQAAKRTTLDVQREREAQQREAQQREAQQREAQQREAQFTPNRSNDDLGRERWGPPPNYLGHPNNNGFRPGEVRFPDIDPPPPPPRQQDRQPPANRGRSKQHDQHKRRGDFRQGRGRGGNHGGDQQPLRVFDLHPQEQPNNNIDPSEPDYMGELMRYCDYKGIPRPIYNTETFPDKGHKVSVIVGSERLELPISFQTVQEGFHRLSRKVLERLYAIHGS